MESYYFLEEELITRMHKSFTQRYNLEQSTAAELTLEIFEILKISGSNLNDINSLYVQ
jgi:hypothetical protein